MKKQEGMTLAFGKDYPVKFKFDLDDTVGKASVKNLRFYFMGISFETIGAYNITEIKCDGYMSVEIPESIRLKAGEGRG
jgi:hypothetical protein